MKIDRKLNLVIPLPEENMYVHSAAIGREIFEKFFKVISRAQVEIFKQGAAYIAGAGPKVALLMLKSVAEELEIWDEVQAGLITEIRRLTNVVVLDAKGWECIPFSVAISKKAIDEDSLADIEGQIVFFTLCSAMMSKKELAGMLEAVNGFWGSQTELSNSTEFAASLPILTQDENSGKNQG